MPHKDPLRKKEWRTAYFKRPSVKAKQKAYHASDKGGDGHLRRRYGLSREQWQTTFAYQGERCAICLKNTPGWKEYKRWCVDHDHDTGYFRGILCRGCNLGIGNLQDDPKLCERAARYLRGEI